LTDDSTDAERERFLEAFTMDLLACDGDSGRVRFLYQELVRLIEAAPE
jgi:hypothetical protein